MRKISLIAGWCLLCAGLSWAETNEVSVVRTADRELRKPVVVRAEKTRVQLRHASGLGWFAWSEIHEEDRARLKAAAPDRGLSYVRQREAEQQRRQDRRAAREQRQQAEQERAAARQRMDDALRQAVARTRAKDRLQQSGTVGSIARARIRVQENLTANMTATGFFSDAWEIVDQVMTSLPLIETCIVEGMFPAINPGTGARTMRLRGRAAVSREQWSNARKRPLPAMEMERLGWAYFRRK